MKFSTNVEFDAISTSWLALSNSGALYDTLFSVDMPWINIVWFIPFPGVVTHTILPELIILQHFALYRPYMTSRTCPYLPSWNPEFPRFHCQLL